MEILTSASQHQHSHWHRHCKKSCFCLQNLLFKNRVFMLFLVLSYGISTTLLQILISPRFPIHPLKGVYSCSRKRLFEHLEASVHCYFKKATAPKVSPYFAYFPAKHPGWSSFQVGLSGIAPKSSLEHLLCRQGFIRSIQMSGIRHKKLNLSTEF